MSDIKSLSIAKAFVALYDTGEAKPLPVTDDFWDDLRHGRLGKFSRMVSSASYDKNWETWERHPAGEEFVCLLDGEVDLVLEISGIETTVTLDQPGAYVLVPTNTWHTARIRRPSKMLFITPGEGTQNRSV